jgi:hypothetical protein
LDGPQAKVVNLIEAFFQTARSGEAMTKGKIGGLQSSGDCLAEKRFHFLGFSIDEGLDGLVEGLLDTAQ